MHVSDLYHISFGLPPPPAGSAPRTPIQVHMHVEFPMLDRRVAGALNRSGWDTSRTSSTVNCESPNVDSQAILLQASDR